MTPVSNSLQSSSYLSTVYLSVCLAIYPSTFLSYLSIYLPTYLPKYQFICLIVWLSAYYLFTYLFIHLFWYRPVYVYFYVCLYICFYVYLHVSFRVSISISPCNYIYANILRLCPCPAHRFHFTGDMIYTSSRCQPSTKRWRIAPVWQVDAYDRCKVDFSECDGPFEAGESCNVTCNPGFNVNLSSLAFSIEMFQCVLREKGSETGVIWYVKK